MSRILYYAFQQSLIIIIVVPGRIFVFIMVRSASPVLSATVVKSTKCYSFYPPPPSQKKTTLSSTKRLCLKHTYTLLEKRFTRLQLIDLKFQVRIRQISPSILIPKSRYFMVLGPAHVPFVTEIFLLH